MTEIVKNEDKKTQVLEINGIKMEIDMRHAKRVDLFRVGDRVRVLKKKGQYDSTTKVLSGVVVGFEPFQTLPTIIIATIDAYYDSVDMKFHYINAENEQYELVASQDDFLPFRKADITNKFDKEIEKKRIEIEDIERKKHYFLSNFNRYFNELEEAERIG